MQRAHNRSIWTTVVPIPENNMGDFILAASMARIDAKIEKLMEMKNMM